MNSVLVVSNQGDISARKVMEWLLFYGADTVRINTQSKPKLNFILIDKQSCINELHTSFKDYKMSDFDLIWYRRGFLAPSYIIDMTNIPIHYNNVIKSHLSQEQTEIENYLAASIQGDYISSPINYRVNKLETLYKAKELGLNVPKTLICNNKEKVLEIFKDDLIICKPISDNIQFNKMTFFSSNSYMVTDALSLPNTFGYTTIQEFITYKHEIRVFVFLDLVYSISNVRTNFNNEKEIGKSVVNDNQKTKRFHPVELPINIRDKLIQLLQNMNLKTGSIDLIVDSNDNYYLIEINPIGQFDYVSVLGNYNIEKDIALELIKYTTYE